MYNLTVATAHTFYVGTGQWLVHNAGACDPFEIAKSGGTHAGFYNNYVDRPTSDILKGIKSIEKQIAEHEDKIANPEKYIPEWKTLDPRQQAALLERKWPGDIQRQKEQVQILQGILHQRGP